MAILFCAAKKKPPRHTEFKMKATIQFTSHNESKNKKISGLDNPIKVAYYSLIKDKNVAPNRNVVI